MRTKLIVVLVMMTIMVSMPGKLTAHEDEHEKLLYDDRSEIALEYRWNLDDIFPSLSAWEDSASKLEAEIPKLAAFKGQLGSSPERLAAGTILISRPVTPRTVSITSRLEYPFINKVQSECVEINIM